MNPSKRLDEVYCIVREEYLDSPNDADEPCIGIPFAIVAIFSSQKSVERYFVNLKFKIRKARWEHKIWEEVIFFDKDKEEITMLFDEFEFTKNQVLMSREAWASKINYSWKVEKSKVEV